jgi:hypothetical protein
MASISLSSTWQSATDWPVNAVWFPVRLTGAGSVEFRFAPLQPSSNAAGIPIEAGTHYLGTPFLGHVPWFRVTSGTATLYYESDSGLPMDVDVVGHAYDDGTVDTFTQTDLISVGFDDSGSTATEYAAYLITAAAAGLSSIAGVYKAALTLSMSSMVSSRTLRVYGLEYASSQASSVTSLTALQGLTKTTAYAEATTSAGARVLVLDITTIIEELQGVGSWSTTSPIQLMIEDTGTAATGLDTLAVIDAGDTTTTKVTILMDDGSELGTGVGEIP